MLVKLSRYSEARQLCAAKVALSAGGLCVSCMPTPLADMLSAPLLARWPHALASMLPCSCPTWQSHEPSLILGQAYLALAQACGVTAHKA
eukprot:scaffold19995_cov19-Tisochrysis_lutea.AAC.1